MRRKRLQHIADTLCHMFCGWRLANNYIDIGNLGSGTLIINALTGESIFNNKPTKELSIAGELYVWLKEDCRSNNIPVEGIIEATIRVTLEMTSLEWKKKTTKDQFFKNDGKHAKTKNINRCIIKCVSNVRTDEIQYESTYSDVEEWPEGWPEI